MEWVSVLSLTWNKSGQEFIIKLADGYISPCYPVSIYIHFNVSVIFLKQYSVSGDYVNHWYVSTEEMKRKAI